MGQREILAVLEAHKNKWYTAQELRQALWLKKRVDVTLSSVYQSLAGLKGAVTVKEGYATTPGETRGGRMCRYYKHKVNG